MSALEMGRRMAESRMTDSCSIARPGERVFDDELGEWLEDAVTVFAGPCRVKSPTTAASDRDSASALVVVSSAELHLPLAAIGVLTGDVVTVTASATRADQVGRVFTIAGPFDGTQSTALRYRIEVADGR